ncbi:ATP-binding protein [Bifidobacterium gallicum]|uniref:ATP-binding protein n=1 Tax=Bifidobacterium gallicum DSM 20093 = LMG 11596 TaxID=561180 RepID=D1NTS7_9BIFI|nr:ATP-binding protein [Bifidobacterium gallicum]EFA23131.1 hypothetical protein BIFGAL_03244 [Bifidobacterium gallicum DSM 20093 = LMG 11596]KFI58807.1 hypothetical protein BGLCM_1101 [Bifidobacterium gallicum DSM 20093 = LMG 11596]
MRDDTTAIIANRWMLHQRQLVNWGSYDGYHTFEPSCDPTMPVTLLTGASESGKSTLLDAQTSLFYPTGIPFNKASNSGRSERSDYTYIRGLIAKGADGNATYLRGTGSTGMPMPVWSAIVDTYINHTDGSTISCAKFMTLAAGADSSSIHKWFLVSDEPIDPRLMDRYRNEPFNKSQLRATYPNAQIYTTQQSFQEVMWRRLGVNEHACRMLYRMQSAQTPNQLDDIFKQGVLDVPQALQYAKDAVEDYERYTEIFNELKSKQQRLNQVQAILSQYETYEVSRQRTRQYLPIDPQTSEGESVILAWINTSLAHHVRQSIPQLVTEREHNNRILASVQEDAAKTEERIKEIQAQLDKHGGTQLPRLEEQRRHAVSDERRARSHVNELRPLLEPLDLTMPDNQEAWETLHDEASDFLNHEHERRMELDDATMNATLSVRETQQVRDQIKAKITQTQQQGVRIAADNERVAARDALAQAAGLSAQDLPYVAELMDVRKDEEQWRDAMNVVYAPLSQIILIDRRHEQGFAKAVSEHLDAHAIMRRNWRFVDLDQHYDDAPNESMLSEKLRFNDTSPFAAWVRHAVQQPQYDAVCVEHIDDSITTRQIQTDGQFKEGTRGAYGSKNIADLIGFVDPEYLAQLDTQYRAAQLRYNEAEKARSAAKEALKTFENQHDLYRDVTKLTWNEVDVRSAVRTIKDLEERITRITSDPDIQQLTEQLERCQQDKRDIDQRVAELTNQSNHQQRLIELEQHWLKNVPESAVGKTHVTPTAQRELAVLDPHAIELMRQTIDNQFGAANTTDSERAAIIVGSTKTGDTKVPDDDDIARFRDMILGKISQAAMAKLKECRTLTDEQATVVEQSMSAYVANHADVVGPLEPSVNDIEGYRNERRQLQTQIAPTALDEQYRLCLGRIQDSLTQINAALRSDTRKITDTLDNINTMFEKLPYGPKSGRMRIQVTIKPPSHTFKNALNDAIDLMRDWSLQGAHTRSQDEATFQELQPIITMLTTLLGKVRNQPGVEQYGAFDLDPRCRTAFAVDVDNPDGTKEHLNTTGGKSGGALQELTSFVYGAALIYLLGGDVDGHPGYTTIFLDEALIKADGNYTVRALKVLPMLGFQIIVSAPESKTSEIMRLATKAVVAVKDPKQERTTLRRAERENMP